MSEVAEYVAAFDWLIEIPIVNFNYKNDIINETKDNVEHVGIYAQDLRDILLKYNYKNRNLLSLILKNNIYEDGEESNNNEYKTPLLI